MGNLSGTGSLYDVALTCAWHRGRGSCKNKFNDPACNQCKWYLYKYCNGDPASVNLMMLQAEMQDANERHDKRKIFLFRLVTVVVLCALFFYCRSESNRNNIRASTIRSPVVEQPRQYKETPVVTVKPMSDEVVTNAMVWDTLKAVNKELVARGLAKDTYVCRYATVSFIRHFPIPSKVRSIHTDMLGFGHAFIQVYMYGKWVDVEPQTYIRGYRYEDGDSYDMRVMWCSDYDPRTNV